MKRKNCCLILILGLICGCASKNKSPQTDEVVTVKLAIKGETQSIHDVQLINAVEIISLECDELIGDINKVVRYGDRLYLLDLFQNRCVYIFSTSGQFIQKIANYGSGPEEYTQLYDVFINSEDSTLNLLTRIDKKLFKYDLDGKRLIGVEKLPKAFLSMLKTSDGYVAYMGNYREDASNPANIWLLDNDFHPVGSCFSIGNESKGFSVEGSALSRFGHTINYIREGDFNVYSVNEGKETISYVFELEGQQQPQNQESRMSNNYIDRFRNFQETKNHALVSFIYNGQYMIGVHRKSDGKTIMATLEPYNGTYFISFGSVVGYDEQAIYAISSASSLKRSWNGKDDYNDFWQEHAQQIRNLRSKFKSIDEEGNPFLIIYSIQ